MANVKEFFLDPVSGNVELEYDTGLVSKFTMSDVSELVSGINDVSTVTPIDVSNQIEQLAADGRSVVNIGKTRDVVTSTGYAYIGSEVFIPWYVSILGEGNQSCLRFDNNSPSTLFKLNTDSNSSWVVPFPAVNFTRVSDMFISSVNGTVTTNPKTIFEIGGPLDLRNIHVGRAACVVKQPSLLYIDSVKIERLMAYSPKFVDDNTWLVDLNYTGDTVDINQCHFFREDEGTPTDYIDDHRPRGIRLRYKAAASIRNIIGGDILVRSCKNVAISELHHEFGFVFIEDSTGELRNSVFWMRGATSGELSGIPFRLTFSDTSVAKSNVWLTENVSFVYQREFPGGGYVAGMPNFSLQESSGTPLVGLMTFRNLWRDHWSEIGGFQTPARIGVTCGVADFDNYSHLASQESSHNGRQWKISGNFSELPATSSGIDVASSSLLNEAKWYASSGTYYYKITLLLDSMRMVGLPGTAEKSFVLTNGQSGPSITLLTDFQKPAMLRIYRGTSTGVYSHYVDVPFLSGGRLFDTGEDICGYPWISRTPAAVDTINNLSVVGMEINPGEFAAASDAYGNAVTRVRSSATIPTVGAWRRGDMVLMENGPSNSAFRFVGWRRITNCTKAAPTHVLGTDWAEIWERYAHPAASAAEFQSATASVNTVFKRRGTMWSDTTSGKILQAMGSIATSVWADSDGTTVYTPV